MSGTFGADVRKNGMRVFNSHNAIEACDDKMTTSILLANKGISMPKTLPSLLCHDQEEVITEETLYRIESQLDYPLIVKTSYGSLGKGVFKIDNRQHLRTISEEVKCIPHLY